MIILTVAKGLELRPNKYGVTTWPPFSNLIQKLASILGGKAAQDFFNLVPDLSKSECDKLVKELYKRANRAKSIEHFFVHKAPAALKMVTLEELCEGQLILEDSAFGVLWVPTYLGGGGAYLDRIDQSKPAIEIVRDVIQDLHRMKKWTEKVNHVRRGCITLHVFQAEECSESNAATALYKMWSAQEQNMMLQGVRRKSYCISCGEDSVVFWVFWNGRVMTKEIQISRNRPAFITALYYVVMNAWLDEPSLLERNPKLSQLKAWVEDVGEVKTMDYVIDNFKQAVHPGYARIDMSEPDIVDRNNGSNSAITSRTIRKKLRRYKVVV